MNIRWSLSYRSCHRVLIPLHQTTSSLEKPSLMYSAIRLLSRKNLNKHGAASNLEGRNRLQNSGTSRNIKERVMFDHVCTFHETYQTFRNLRGPPPKIAMSEMALHQVGRLERTRCVLGINFSSVKRLP